MYVRTLHDVLYFFTVNTLELYYCIWTVYLLLLLLGNKQEKKSFLEKVKKSLNCDISNFIFKIF